MSVTSLNLMMTTNLLSFRHYYCIVPNILNKVFPNRCPCCSALPYLPENGTSRRIVGTQPLHKLTKPLLAICVCSTLVSSVEAAKVGEYTVIAIVYIYTNDLPTHLLFQFPSHFLSLLFFPNYLKSSIH